MELRPSRPDDRAEIARRFKALRRRSLLTQRYLAGLIGVCRQAVSDIERQQVMPHRTTWDQFAALEAKHKLFRVKLPVHWQ
jgi:DNA-binding XRE family transcriptional regulator